MGPVSWPTLGAPNPAGGIEVGSVPDEEKPGPEGIWPPPIAVPGGPYWLPVGAPWFDDMAELGVPYCGPPGAPMPLAIPGPVIGCGSLLKLIGGACLPSLV
jgi:hypothetical protein